MDLRIFTEPQQGASHSVLLSAARATAAAGFSAFFRSDHLLAMGGDGLPGPSDSVASLAALTAQVPELRFGTLVSSATFRHPSMLALATATIGDISGGRIELGLGAGWFEAEHAAYGVPFGASFGERFDRLTEQLEIITGLWATPPGETYDHAGQYFQLTGAPALPKPIQTRADGTPGIPIIVGGHGPKRTPALAARFADEFNVGFSSFEVSIEQVARVRAACEAIGRDPGTMTFSIAGPVCCGTDDAQLTARAAAIGQPAEQIGEAGYVGAPAQIVDQLGRFVEAGVSRAYLQVLDLADLDHIALLGSEVLPALA